MKSRSLCLVAGLAFLGFQAPAGATPIRFEIAGASASTSGVSAGSTVNVTPSAGLAQVFYLDVGQTTNPFNFLDITVTGKGVVGGMINAALTFTDPTTTSAQGVLAGFSVILGWQSPGSLWVVNDPGPIAFGNGGLFDVDFFGFSTAGSFCQTLSGSVTASVKLLRAPTVAGPPVSVPEPTTLSLLGVGLLALCALRRRRTR